MTEVSFCIGCTPSEEPCAQTCVTPGWIELQKLEAEVYRAALIAKFGPPPGAVRMAITTHPHDFGRYAELEIRFDSDDPVAVAYFELIEDGLGKWLEVNFTAPVEYDDQAKAIKGSQRKAVEVIAGGLATSRQLVLAGIATDREHSAIKHLEAAYPDIAAEVSIRLAA